jgi:glycosyltransferase involved in cell wall biosynthesis
MTLRVGADARCLNTNFVRGMGEYLAPLSSAMSADYDIDWIFYGNRPDIPLHRPAGVAPLVRLHDIPGDRFQMWEQVAMPAECLLHRVDVLHCVATTLPLWQPVPTVVTIHDTIPWDTGEFVPPGPYRDRILPTAFRRCAKIITISEHSKSDILRRWPELAPRLRVIRHGLNPRFLDGGRVPLTHGLIAIGIKEPYLLYFGGMAERKRLPWMLELYDALNRMDIGLVVCGVPEAAHDRYRATLRPELRQHVVFAPFLAADDMPSLYQHALAVLYPTLYEGFGVPPLNAQAAGTPAIFSDVSSLKEMVGPTGIPLPPEDTRAWLEACHSVIDRRLASMAPDEPSRRWAGRFSWENSAAAHWEVYNEAAAKGRRMF